MSTPTIEGKVGVFYMVPCIHVARSFYGFNWVPVIGTKHRDPEIGADWDHWHIDWRFAPEAMVQQASVRTVPSPHGAVISNDGPGWDQGIRGTPVMKRRLCKRVMPDFPATPGRLWVKMEKAQRARCDRLKDGHICPHRGVDLRPFEREDGTAICPGHGLHWNLKTGELIPRHGVSEVKA